VNNKEKLYLAKIAGAAPGFWAGKGTGADKGVGAAAGVTAGLGATPIPVMDARNLRRSSKDLAKFKELTSGLGFPGVEQHTKRLEGINKNLDRKVPGYMRTEHTGIPTRPLTVGPDSGHLSMADVLSGK
jgi:hypothetical protein